MTRSNTKGKNYRHPRALTTSDEDPTPNRSDVKGNTVVVQSQAPHDDEDASMIGEQLRKRSEGPPNPVIVLLTVILVFAIV